MNHIDFRSKIAAVVEYARHADNAAAPQAPSGADRESARFRQSVRQLASMRDAGGRSAALPPRPGSGAQRGKRPLPMQFDEHNAVSLLTGDDGKPFSNLHQLLGAITYDDVQTKALLDAGANPEVRAAGPEAELAFRAARLCEKLATLDPAWHTVLLAKEDFLPMSNYLPLDLRDRVLAIAASAVD